jgi:hypothetical protein
VGNRCSYGKTMNSSVCAEAQAVIGRGSTSLFDGLVTLEFTESVAKRIYPFNYLSGSII